MGELYNMLNRYDTSANLIIACRYFLRCVYKPQSDGCNKILNALTHIHTKNLSILNYYLNR